MILVPQRVALLGGAANTWTPLLLGSSLLGWWDAEDATKLTLSGSNVTTWTDKVGGYAPTQAVGGSKPIYSATGFNGRPGITFDGIDDYLGLESQPFPATCEIWALVDQTVAGSDANDRPIMTFGGTGSATRYGVNRDPVSGANAARATNGAASATNAGDFSGKHVIRAIFSATAFSIAQDGNTAASATSSTTIGSTRVRIATTTATSPTAFGQFVLNSLIVTGSLVQAQSDALLAFLKARGGIA